MSPHAIELPFVFGNLGVSNYIPEVTPAAEALRDAMSGAWAAFARNGLPDFPGILQWLPYEPALRATMMFGTNVHLQSDPFAQQRIFMNTFGSEQLGAYEPRPPGPWIRD